MEFGWELGRQPVEGSGEIAVSQNVSPVRTTDLKAMKARGEKIAMLTAYDALMARLLDRAGVDVLLVGDSVGMVLLGYETTIPVTLEDMIRHTQAVVRGVRRALVVADMPFLTCHTSLDDAVRSAGRLVQQGGAHAVKVEGGGSVVPVVRRLVDAGIPVMGHLGLTPQRVHQLGGFRTQARSAEEAEALMTDAAALERAGVFALVLEAIPSGLARRVTQTAGVPTIGIGAGPHCDGQVLVTHDALGLTDGAPSFVKHYARLADAMVEAVTGYVSDVKAGAFPSATRSRGDAREEES